jgi:SAM-dependent methyltransferase
MTIQEMHQSNRAAWNEAAVSYAEDLENRIAFLRGGGMNFCSAEEPYLHDLATWCGRAIHLQCAGGTDTLSLWNKGAKEVVGVDISEDMIAVARQKSAALNAPAEWFCCDILETPHELDGTADLVYTGRGALCWLQDMDGWAAVVARLLKPGGRLYLFEGHPMTWVWSQEAAELTLDPVYGNYFQTAAQEEQGWGPTYIGELSKPKEELSRKYESQKTFGQILNPLLQAGLCLEKLEEHAETYWDQYENLSCEVIAKLPNTFSLLMRKE